MQHDIPFQHFSGEHSRQAHAALPEGTYEEEYGRDGFFGPTTHIYHKHPPTGWTRIEGPLRPRAFYLDQLAEANPDQRMTVVSNASCSISIWKLTASMNYLWRNGDGDELLFVHKGAGEMMTELGRHTFSEGDYLLVPRGIGYQINVTEPATFLVVQATNNRFKLPDKGLLGPHAIFDPAMLAVPVAEGCKATPTASGEYEVRIKRGDRMTSVFYPHDPTDIAGWKGDTTVFRLNWRDIRPIVSHRYHVPPSVHTTFISERFVVCTFVPRPFESSPDALKVPFFHRNIDYDEFIFLHSGNFMSRDNARPAMATLHPVGIHHGPHPKALANQGKVAMADEVAVMVDFRDAVEVSAESESCEFKEYVDSWKGYLNGKG